MNDKRRRSKTILNSARWAGYAAAGAAAFGAHEVSDAAIVHSGPINVDLAGANANAYYDIDLNGDSVDDVAISNQTFQFAPGSTVGGALVRAGFGDHIVGFSANGDAYAYNFPIGAQIGSTPPFGQDWENSGAELILAFSSFTPQGQFGNAGEGFIGVEFNIGADTHYGWVRVENRVGAPGQMYTLVDYAYEDTPNTPINAGAIPEPGSLGLLALGAVGLLGWRRRITE